MAVTKSELRNRLRAARREYAASIPDSMRGLVFRHPPAPVLEMIPQNAVIGLYSSLPEEAPTTAYASHFHERGHTIALPRFASLDTPMEFAHHTDPFGQSDLVESPFGMQQPAVEAEPETPGVLFIPLVGFTERGERLGQGGGHYDRWLAAHPDTIAIGMGWDCQLVDSLPTEQHDHKMTAIITPTRIYGPFDA